ncbi:unnamed protein product [Trichogramma brassicae]|uniref:Uncharacterized protein n=1 Tax=Trichogramma brassicae TaxID=86971 RepID=A0A6H5IYU4_9HYME|nr:unnamed protein product [Trichogramma brassicae]
MVTPREDNRLGNVEERQHQPPGANGQINQDQQQRAPGANDPMNQLPAQLNQDLQQQGPGANGQMNQLPGQMIQQQLQAGLIDRPIKPGAGRVDDVPPQGVGAVSNCRLPAFWRTGPELWFFSNRVAVPGAQRHQRLNEVPSGRSGPGRGGHRRGISRSRSLRRLLTRLMRSARRLWQRATRPGDPSRRRTRSRELAELRRAIEQLTTITRESIGSGSGHRGRSRSRGDPVRENQIAYASEQREDWILLVPRDPRRRRG